MAPETRDRLLDAAWVVARERGVDQLTLAEVAKAAGVSRQAVYLHFGNRATLLVEMARRRDRSSGFLDQVVATRAQEPVEALRALLAAWFAYLPTILPVARALEAAAVAGNDGAEAYLDRMGDWREGLRLALGRVADEGRLAGGWDVDRASDWLWMLTHPTAYHHLVAERGWSPADVEATTFEVVDRELLGPVGGRSAGGAVRRRRGG